MEAETVRLDHPRGQSFILMQELHATPFTAQNYSVDLRHGRIPTSAMVPRDCFRVSSKQPVQRIPSGRSTTELQSTTVHREVDALSPFDHGTPTTTPCSLVGKGEYVMQKHALALGYFFLAVFCIFTCSQGFLQLFYIPLLLAALAAALMGLGFLLSACAPQFPAVKKWLVQMVRVAQEPPVESKQRSADGQSAY